MKKTLSTIAVLATLTGTTAMAAECPAGQRMLTGDCAVPPYEGIKLFDENEVASCVALRVQDYKNAGATVAVTDIDGFRVSCVAADLSVRYLKSRNLPLADMKTKRIEIVMDLIAEAIKHPDWFDGVPQIDNEHPERLDQDMQRIDDLIRKNKARP